MWKIVHAATEAANSVAGTEGQSTGQAPQSPLLKSMLPFLVVILLIYFVLLWPQRKRDKERREMLASLAKGDRVVTTGGACGTVVGLSEKTVVLRVSEEDNIKMEFVRGAISQVTSRGEKKD